MQAITVGGLDAALRTLRLAYQPIVRWSLQAVVGYEALCRCEGIGPAALFELAERSGRVHELSRRVRELSHVSGGLDLYLNLHPRDLEDVALYVESPGNVVYELAEREPPLAGSVARLRELGYRIALDDLGAGRGELATLATLRPDIVKLDMALVRNVDRDPKLRRVVGTLRRLCSDLGASMICEGVETRAELDVLRSVGCDLFQGFLFGIPVPV